MSSLRTQALPLPPNSPMTQALQPVQCLMSSLVMLMNSISAPASFAAISASLHSESFAPFSVPADRPKTFICVSSFYLMVM